MDLEMNILVVDDFATMWRVSSKNPSRRQGSTIFLQQRMERSPSKC